MASALTLAIAGISAVAGLAGTVISTSMTMAGAKTAAQGAVDLGEAQANMYNYQSGIALANERMLRANADYALAAGEIQAGEYGMKSRFQAGAIKTRLAASGVDVNTGSAQDIVKSQNLVSRIDQTDIRTNAARTAFGYQVAAGQQKAQANVYTMAGQNAIMAGRIGAQGSLLSGATSVASQWTKAFTGGAVSGGVGAIGSGLGSMFNAAGGGAAAGEAGVGAGSEAAAAAFVM